MVNYLHILLLPVTEIFLSHKAIKWNLVWFQRKCLFLDLVIVFASAPYIIICYVSHVFIFCMPVYQIAIYAFWIACQNNFVIMHRILTTKRSRVMYMMPPISLRLTVSHKSTWLPSRRNLHCLKMRRRKAMPLFLMRNDKHAWYENT